MTTPRPLGVLQLVGNLDVGGAQQVVVTLSKYLARGGHRPVVGTFRDGPLRSDLEELGIPVVVLENRRGSVLAVHRLIGGVLRTRRTLAELVARHDIDVIQTHLLRSLDFVVATLPRAGGRPLVYWTFHNYNFMLRREHLPSHRWLLRPKQLGYRWLYRLLSRRVSGLVAVSDEVREAILQEIGGVDDKIVIIANGVDVDLFGDTAERERLRRELGANPDDFVMAMVATFKRQKGHVHLIEAMAQVQPSHPDARVILVGDGELREIMTARVEEAGLTDTIRFLGSRRDVAALLAAADCFVLPSLWEGLPIALLEAMASKLPCIATQVSGTEQVVVPGVTGLLVPPGDSTAFAAAIEDVLADRSYARQMGTAGRSRVESDFSAERQAGDHVRRFVTDLQRLS
jgi:glycosyltransferase involved in cell wall biosynthesis